MAAPTDVESTDFPVKKQREDGENGVSEIVSAISKHPQPQGISAVIPGWFSEISPMWPVMDVLLWKNWRGGAALLVSSSTLWYLFECAGYNFLSFFSNVVLLLIVILFLWAKAANLLNRPLPPLPDLEIPEETIARIADALQIWINRGLSVAHDIAIQRNWVLCLQVVGVLWVISCIGSLFNFLTLIYICVLLSLALPLLYDKYKDQIDDKLHVIHGSIHPHYQKIQKIFLTNFPKPSNKEKKVQ